MGYHKEVYDGLEKLVKNAVSVPVLDGLGSQDATKLAAQVVIVRNSLTAEPSEIIGGGPQYEHWEWKLHVIGGAGAARKVGSAQHVDTLLERLREGLATKSPTDDCGPLQLVDEVYEGLYGNGVMYIQTWTHSRFAG